LRPCSTASQISSGRAQQPHAATSPVTWASCATTRYPKLECASVRVPLDYAKPGGRQIKLALSRIKHTSAKYQGPLLVNPGGPGGSGLTLAGFRPVAGSNQVRIPLIRGRDPVETALKALAAVLPADEAA